jgi:hypothetical protein
MSQPIHSHIIGPPFYFLNILADKEEKGKSRRAYKKRAFGFIYAI